MRWSEEKKKVVLYVSATEIPEFWGDKKRDHCLGQWPDVNYWFSNCVMLPGAQT